MKNKKTLKSENFRDNSKRNFERQIKFLKSVIENLINKQAVPIIDLLAGKKNINEFLIAKKLGLTINQARNILYKMSDFGLVSFIRKKDKRKGWYIYFWTLNTYQSLNLLEQNFINEMNKLKEQLRERKEKSHYFCDTCSLEVSEENALLNNFICPECEKVYQLSSDKEIIENLEKNIAKLQRDIELVHYEREKEMQKLEKKKTEKIKRSEAKKVKIRKKQRMEKAILKKKTLKNKKNTLKKNSKKSHRKRKK